MRCTARSSGSGSPPILDPRLLGRLVQALVERGAVEALGDGLRVKGRGRSLSLDEEAARTKAVAAIAAGGLAPPTLAEIGRMLSLPAERVAGLLQGPLADHTVVKVTEELCFHASALAELKQRLVAHLTEHRGDHHPAVQGAGGRQPEVRHPALRVLRPGEGHPPRRRQATPPTRLITGGVKHLDFLVFEVSNTSARREPSRLSA